MAWRVGSQCHRVAVPASVPHLFVLHAEAVSSFGLFGGKALINIRVEVFVGTSVFIYFWVNK